VHFTWKEYLQPHVYQLIITLPGSSKILEITEEQKGRNGIPTKMPTMNSWMPWPGEDSRWEPWPNAIIRKGMILRHSTLRKSSINQ
jgi:hypothetical protein